MSTSGEAALAKSQMAIESEAAQWLQRRQFWDWSASDQAELDGWLAQSTAHEIAFIRLMAGYNRTDRLVALRAPRMDRGALTRLLRIAAGLAVVAALGTWAIQSPPAPKETKYVTPVGGRQTIMLADGSRIDLNTDSVLRLGRDATRRLAFLDKGEAYFQIKHDASRPFVVTAGTHRVVDLGTKFLVRTGGDRMDVTLVEGRARIDANGGARSVDLLPGDEVIATARQLTTVHKTSQDLSNQLGWRRGVIVFRHTTLADAAAEFNRYNPNRIVIGSAAAAALKIDGTFPSDDPDSFAEIAQVILHLRVERRGQSIVLTK
jgi:transmembrane sensor